MFQVANCWGTKRIDRIKLAMADGLLMAWRCESSRIYHITAKKSTGGAATKYAVMSLRGMKQTRKRPGTESG